MNENYPLTENGDEPKNGDIDSTSNLVRATTSTTVLPTTMDQGVAVVTTNCGLSDTSTCSSSTEDSGIGMETDGGLAQRNELPHLPPPPLNSSTGQLGSPLEYTIPQQQPQPHIPPLHTSYQHAGLTQLPISHGDNHSPTPCPVTLYPNATGSGNGFPCLPCTNTTFSSTITTSSRLGSYPTLSLLPPVTSTISGGGFQPISPWLHQQQPNGNGHSTHLPQPHPLTPISTPNEMTLVSLASTTSATVPSHIPVTAMEWPLKSITKAQSTTLLYGMFTRTEDGTRWKCEECQRLFSSQGSLRAHARIHTGERPYQCQYCFRTFCQASTLRSHERLHTGEKPYKCEHCGRAFTQSAGLRSHLKTHRYDS